MTTPQENSPSAVKQQEQARQLKAQALSLIASLAGESWSDHNTSDPGITILEVLAFVISDLSERLNFPMGELLQGDPSQASPPAFFSPQSILPSNPVTLIDHRRALIDIEGVKNANLLPHEEAVDDEPLSTGSFDIVLDLDDDIFSIQDSALKHAQIAGVIRRVRQGFIRQRNVNEDIASIRVIPKKPVILQMEIELTKAVDPVVVIAEILTATAENIAPSINSDRYDQLLEKGMAGDDIFDGPLLEQGFISEEDVERIGMPLSLYSSDILSSLRAVDGLKNIANFSFVLDDDDNDDIENKTLAAMDKGALFWRREIQKDHIASLNLAETYAHLTLKIDGQEIQRPDFDSIITQQTNSRKPIELGHGLPSTLTHYVNGQYRQLKSYASLQHRLPAVYKLAEKRLDGAVNSTAMAQILQLKGFLTFFDQVLSDQFAQLETLKTLLALPTHRVFYRLAKTFSQMFASESLTKNDVEYFWQDVNKLPKTQLSQPIKDISGMATLLGDYFESYGHCGFQQQAEAAFSFVQLDRLKRSVEHLFSRFAETSLDASLLKYKAVFDPYLDDFKQAKNAIMASDNPEHEGQALLTKLVTLKQVVDLVLLMNDYPMLSKLRAGGFNYLVNNPKQRHSGGLAQRIMRFLGLFSLQQMPLSTSNKEGFYLIESELIRFGAFDPSLLKSEEYHKNRLYFVAPEWPSRFANGEFRTLLESQIVKDCPVSMQPFIIYLPREDMSLFERLYFAWLNAMSNLPLASDEWGRTNSDNTDQVDERLSLVKSLSGLLRQFFQQTESLSTLILSRQPIATISDEIRVWLTLDEQLQLTGNTLDDLKTSLLAILKARFENMPDINNANEAIKGPAQRLLKQILFAICQQQLDLMVRPFPISIAIIGKTFRIRHKPLHYLHPAYPIGNGVINSSNPNIPTFTLGIKTPHTL